MKRKKKEQVHCIEMTWTTLYKLFAYLSSIHKNILSSHKKGERREYIRKGSTSLT